MNQSPAHSILIVDDEEGIRHGLSHLFMKEGFSVTAVDDAAEALSISQKTSIDIAIIDIRLKGGANGIELLEALKENDPDIRVIMITGYGSIESAVESMKRGASDYILKPIENAALLEIVRKNLEFAQLKKDNTFLKHELLSRVYAHDIITRDPEFLSVIARADQVKNTSASVLIEGESGTGKEVLARYIHFTSNRKDGPFVGINCAALSESLLLSELFGHERGAFTGASERKLGKFELAHKGTLFLDEIGDMALSVQAKLLRVLEESAFERVGGTKRISVDIRVIAATNKDLQELIKHGEFRSDLYYRINIVELRLPALRNRRSDIPLLTNFFLRKYAEQYRKNIMGLSPEVESLFYTYEWPGNVRELQNSLNQAVLLSHGTVIDLAAVNSGAFGRATSAETDFDAKKFRSLKDLASAAVAYYERTRICEVLDACRGNHSRAARELGITRKTLLKKLQEYGIHSKCKSSGSERFP